MRWIDSSVKLIDDIDATAILTKLELALRNCYKSEDKITEGSAKKLIGSCIARGHESPLEHVSISYRVICDRGVSHEWVRHRLASYSQESSRYCNYSKGKFGSELTFVKPYWYNKIPNISKFVYTELDSEQKKYIDLWTNMNNCCKDIEKSYIDMIQLGASTDMARAILPNCIKTEIVCTMNIRELRNFFKLRTSNAAHDDIKKLAIKLLNLLKGKGLSILFNDIIIED